MIFCIDAVAISCSWATYFDTYVVSGWNHKPETSLARASAFAVRATVVSNAPRCWLQPPPALVREYGSDITDRRHGCKVGSRIKRRRQVRRSSPVAASWLARSALSVHARHSLEGHFEILLKINATETEVFPLVSQEASRC